MRLFLAALLLFAPIGAWAQSVPTSTPALAASLVVKNSSGKLYSWEFTPDSTLSASTWYVMIFDAASAPSDGAVTPLKCYTVPAGQPTTGGVFGGGITFTTGIVLVASTTGCYTKTASAHAYISGDYL